MKPVFSAAIALVPLAAAAAAAAPSDKYYCPACPVESKVPSATTPGEFEFAMTCVEDGTGVTAALKITATDEKAALKKAWSSPRLEEVFVGLEINAYNCAVR